MVWLPLSIQPALCAVLFMFVGQKAREASLFNKGALPPALWICALMTWLYCGAFYGQLYIVSNTYQHGAIDVIGGICGAAVLIKLSGLVSERLPAATRLSRLDRAEHASTILHAPRHARRCPVECALHLVRCPCAGSLAHHAGSSCRVFERVDGGVVCAAEAGAEAVLCGGEGRIDFDTFTSLNGTGESLDKVASTAFASVLPLAPKRQ